MSEKQFYNDPNNSSSSSSSNNNNSSSLSRPVRRHLLNVYLTLAAMCAIATASSQAAGYLGPSGPLVGTVGTVASVTMFRYTTPGSQSRWSLLIAYSIFAGIALSTFLSILLHWDPSGSVIFMSLSSAVLIFLGFSLSAVMAERRSMLYVGGLASSALGILLWLSLANSLFFRSSSIYSFELYTGLLSFAGFVLHDTQMIIERASIGSMDIPGHSMELFMDLYAMFVKLAEIFLKKENDRENERRRKRGPNRLRRN